MCITTRNQQKFDLDIRKLPLVYLYGAARGLAEKVGVDVKTIHGELDSAPSLAEAVKIFDGYFGDRIRLIVTDELAQELAA